MVSCWRPRQSTNETLSTDLARIAELDSEIEALELLLLPLHEERKQAQARLDAYKYPVLTLPNEIVSEIFTHFLPVYPRRPPATGRRSPTLLSHICRKWREIALYTPSLWRAISISLANIQSVEPQLLETWLARSGSCPLSFRISDVWSVDGTVARRLIRAIVAHCDRWEHMNFQIRPDAVPLIQGSMPLLQHLKFGVLPNMPWAVGLENQVAVFQDAPHLHDITLGEYDTSKIILPLAQFTRLSTLPIPHYFCLEILEKTPNIVHFETQILSPETLRSDIRLAHLETLLVYDYGIADVALTGFLASLTLPALRRLLIPERFLLPEPVDSLVAFVARSKCTLQEVCITMPTTSETVYRKALPSIPTLMAIHEELAPHPDSESETDSNSDTGSEEDGGSVEDELSASMELDDSSESDEVG